MMEPEEFKKATWDLFDSSEGVLKFVFPDMHIEKAEFWKIWKYWKVVCSRPIIMGMVGKNQFPPEIGSLTLPGEPMGRV